MSLQEKIIQTCKTQGVDFVHFVDISHMPKIQNQGFPNAIIFGMALSSKYLDMVTKTPEYVPQMIKNNLIHEDEFHVKEIQTDQIADDLAEVLVQKGFAAYSQSEKSNESTGHYDVTTKTTPLPHKTIAGLAGLGWIGKHNLLVTDAFGSAISMCSVLTDAPLETVLNDPMEPLCEECQVCQEICSVHAIQGNLWHIKRLRDDLVNVDVCNTCLKCMVHCPFTQKYMNNQTTRNR